MLSTEVEDVGTLPSFTDDLDEDTEAVWAEAVLFGSVVTATLLDDEPFSDDGVVLAPASPELA